MRTRAWYLPAMLLAVMCWQGCPPAGGTGKASLQQDDSTATGKVLRYEDWVYEPNVRTVQLYRNGYPMSYPFLYLGEEMNLVLEFDVLQTIDLQPEDYWIDVVSCDFDWTPSGLLPLEFTTGFSTDRMYFNTRSQNTRIPYVHYRYEFPARGSSFKKSGNYLLRVYRAGNEEDLVLTKRLIVADHKVFVAPQMGAARMATDRRKIQRVDFSVKLATPFPGILDPRTDLHVYILQNFRWDNAVGGLYPMFNSPEQLDYSFDAANNFEGGNEYRALDIRTTRFRSNRIQSIVDEDSVVRFTLVPDEPRLRNTSSGRPDLNGNYLVQVQEYPNASYEADYVFVRFGLKWGEPLKTGDVYLLGKHNDWRLEPENQLYYNAATSRYECELLLKQGYYDYAYAVKDTTAGSASARKGVVDETKFEGSHAETENYYTILVYYKPIGMRGSELVGMSHVNFYDH